MLVFVSLVFYEWPPPLASDDAKKPGGKALVLFILFRLIIGTPFVRRV